MHIRQPLSDLLQLWYPSLCPICEMSVLAKDQFACLACFGKLRPLHLSQGQQSIIKDRFAIVNKLEMAGSLFHFARGTASQLLLHRIKYANYAQAAAPLGTYMAKHWRAELSPLFPFTVVPVPLHWSKKMSRGFNQSELIARSFAAELGQTFDKKILKRTRHTRTQTLKSKGERMQNVHNAFQMKNIPINTKRILLLDDVVTSGATMLACHDAFEKSEGPKLSYIFLSVCLAI